MMTLIIIFLPQSRSPVAIMTPPITMRTNEVMRITVTRILVRLPISTGNAFDHTAAASSHTQTAPLLLSMQLPMKGILVLSLTPQQTHLVLQEVHVQLIHLKLVSQEGGQAAPNE